MKRALLIGSGLEGAPKPQGCPTYPPLGRAVKDTRELAGLLNSTYGYPKENTVVLVDAKGVAPNQTSTMDNIRRELVNFTKDAKPGDHFFFYFAGHSDRDQKIVGDDQDITNYIVPCDYWSHREEVPTSDRMISSHELRKLLVDTLPVGADVYAVFDACNSGRLLDLLHYRCNDIYFPWISPGFRRRMTKWRSVRRRDDCIMDEIELALGKGVSSQLVDEVACTTPPSSRKSSTSSIRIYQRKRLGRDEVQTVDTSVNLVNGKGKHRQVSVSRRQSSTQRRGSSSLLQVIEGSQTAPSADAPDILNELGLLRCASPTEELECGGFECQSSNADEEVGGPNVVSIAACRESQNTWDTKTYSFTQALIRALRIDPHQTIGKLIDTLTFGAYNHGRRLHAWSQERRESWKQKVLQSADYDAASYLDASADQETQKSLELLNYFEPQVGSQKPMILQQVFDP